MTLINGEEMDAVKLHGCRFEDRQLEILNTHFERLNEQNEAKDKWVKEYIDRTMPIKSHFWILLGSLSILSAFAAVMHYIDRIGL